MIKHTIGFVFLEKHEMLNTLQPTVELLAANLTKNWQ